MFYTGAFAKLANDIEKSHPNFNATVAWEDAYKQFETPESEMRKFSSRLEKAGAAKWDRSAKIVEIFCGRGGGLDALSGMGFTNLEGVDISQRLLDAYHGTAKIYCADCRKLPLPDHSRDIIIVQGGLHHLPVLPDDLKLTLMEVVRVLKPGGLFIMAEPWRTPFLELVLSVCSFGPLRRLWGKLEAISTMVALERDTYFHWLNFPKEVDAEVTRLFNAEVKSISMGTYLFVGRPK